MYSRRQRGKRDKISLRLAELKEEAVKLQNQYWKDIAKEEEIKQFIMQVINWKKSFIGEVMKISVPKAKQCEYLGMIDETPFLQVRDPLHRKHLAIINEYWQLADKVLDQYSKDLA